MEIGAVIAVAIGLATAIGSPAWPDPAAAPAVVGQAQAQADFKGEGASPEARRMADWVTRSGDNGTMAFVIVDKVKARVFVFDGRSRLLGASPALLGFARGDDTTPGIGHRKLAAIGPSDRTTPAGRFVGALGEDYEQDVLWIDYDAALSLHRVIRGAPSEHRRERLQSASALDKRISYGCINVPAAFYDTVVKPAFTGVRGVVYILPETRPLESVFPAA
jgi:hypothetical protein